MHPELALRTVEQRQAELDRAARRWIRTHPAPAPDQGRPRPSRFRGRGRVRRFSRMAPAAARAKLAG